MQRESEIGVGIDFGTSNSCVGVYINGTVKIASNSIGERITPSVLLFKTINEALSGEDAFSNNVENIKNYIYEVKRFIGLDYEEFEESGFQDTLNYDVVNIEGTPQIKIESEGQTNYLSIEKICSLIIKKIIQNAEDFIGTKITKAVFTVPAQFTNRQKESILKAAEMLGIKVQRLIYEPTAAALAYKIGHNLEVKKEAKKDLFMSTVIGDDYSVAPSANELRKSEETVLAFDLGGGTFDLTIFKVIKEKKGLNFEILLTKGDIHLGGSDFDKKLIDYCIKYFSEENQLQEDDIDNIKKDPILCRKLKIKCENAKKLLSVKNEVFIQINNFYKNIDLYLKIRQTKFEEICKSLFERINNLINSVLEEIKYTPDDIDKVILVGGGTRMCGIKDLLIKKFGENKIEDNINPEEAVAIGATLDSAKIQNQDKIKFTLQDIIPFDLGIEVKNKGQKEGNNKGIMYPIIKKYSKIPCSKEKKFDIDLTNDHPDIVVNIYEGNNSEVRKNITLGNYTNTKIIEKGKFTYSIKLEIDVNGKLKGYIRSDQLKINDEILINIDINIGYFSGKKIKIFKNKNLGVIDNILKNIDKKKEDIKNSPDTRTKLKNLIICSGIYEELINIYKSFITDNENAYEKMLAYTTELFLLYSERIKTKIDKNDILIEKIKQRMLDLIEMPDYIELVLKVFKDLRLESDYKNEFYLIFNNSMEMLNKKGQQYLKGENFRRYYAKLYFEKVFFSIKKYVDRNDFRTIEKEIKEKFDLIKSKNEEDLNKLNSFASVVEIYADEGEIIFGKTGITKIAKKIQKIKENPTKEDALEILDILQNMVDSFDKSKKEIGEAYCLGNIIIIHFNILKKKIDDKLRLDIERFELIMKGKDGKQYSWYDEVRSTIDYIIKNSD